MKAMILTLCCLLTVSTSVSLQVEESILADDRVISVEVLSYHNMVLVAIRTKPIFLRSENIEIITRARNAAGLTLSSEYTVYLSLDADIYNEIIYMKRNGETQGVKIRNLADKMLLRENKLLESAV